MAQDGPAQNVEQMHSQIQKLLPEEKKQALKEALRNKLVEHKDEIKSMSKKERTELIEHLRSTINGNAEKEEILRALQTKLDNERAENSFDKTAQNWEGADANPAEMDTNETRNKIADTWATLTADLEPEQKAELQKQVQKKLGLAHAEGGFLSSVTKEEADEIAFFIAKESAKLRKENKAEALKADPVATTPPETLKTDPKENPPAEEKKQVLQKSAEDQFNEASKLFKEGMKAETWGGKLKIFAEAFKALMGGITAWSKDLWHYIPEGAATGGGLLAWFRNIGKKAQEAEGVGTPPEKTVEAEAKKHSENLKKHFKVDDATLTALSKLTAEKVFADNFDVAKFKANHNLTIDLAELPDLIKFAETEIGYDSNADSKKTLNQILFSTQAQKALAEKMKNAQV